MRLSRILTRSPANPQTLQDLNYLFDKNGNITTLTDNLRTNIRTYQYDDLDRLTQANNLPSPQGGYTTYTYQYDAIGNMTYKSDTGVMTYGSSGLGTGTTPHAVMSAAGYSYTYDLNGNMVQGKNKAFEYDAENRLTKVTESGTITSFTYDGDGGRVKKTSTSALTSTSTVYIGSLFEIDSGGKTTKHIFAGSQRICSVAKDEGRGTTDASYYHSDHLGSSSVITDANGNQVEHYEYTPYGSLAVQELVSRPSSLVHHRFTGKELDNTGLYFYGARYYDPEIGRFVTADTIVQSPYDPQSLNRYAYCRNNPINYVDPTGHSFWKKFWQTIVGVVATVISIAIPVLAPVMWAINSAISLYTSIQSGNMLGFAGGIVGGAVFGALGKSMALGLAGRMGDAAWSFGGGALGGAIEFGMGGFGAGFVGALAGGQSFGDSLKAGGFGAAIGAATGAAIQGSYVAGWQDSLHGYSIGELGMAQGNFAIQSGNLQNLSGIDSWVRTRTGDQYGLYIHGTDLKGAVGIAASRRLNDSSWVTRPNSIDSKTGRMAAFLSPRDYQRFTSIDPPKGEYFALAVAPKSSIVDRGLARGGAPQFQVFGENKVTEVYANLNH